MSTVLSHSETRLLPLPVRTATYNHDPLLYINREAKYIERNLQTLIDAQSDGLMAGLAGPSQEDTYSDSGHTPTSSELGSPRRPSTVPVRQPTAKKIGLRAAREGIFKSIDDLLKLREDEREIIASRFSERKDALSEVDEFKSKAGGLEDAISSINNRPENQRPNSLQEEARILEADIHELETKLYEMKARHRHIINEISHVENSVEAKLSSYKSSLSMLQSDIRKYLQNPPLQPLASGTSAPTFYSLPRKRRTLEMAQEHWSGEQEELQKRQAEVDWEIAALEEGGGVWKRVISEVTGFERRLKAEMHRSTQGQSQLVAPDGPSGSKDSRVKAIIEDLQDTAHRVEEQLELADDRNWNLLVCCVSAELEALRAARQMLLNTFNVSEGDLWPEGKDESAEETRHVDREDSQIDSLGADNPEPPADLLRDSHRQSQDGAPRSEDEDDEPDPAWLLPES
ncbi:hypothetical protein PHISP_04220 [Aspergillus sp. HF37]|nr:hypothetical protein PHISP_04220 [Aspergillus sp. HF37]